MTGWCRCRSDGGESWTACEPLPGLPEHAFVNDVEACLHRSGAAFVAADDHKNGDYSPYLYETVDGGQTWRSIRGDLPDGVIIWQIEQDHIDPSLLFLGAENGLYVSLDGGEHWHRMGQGDKPTMPTMPTISVRDLAIQRRDSDLVAATFGRGFYVLDDYSPLRFMGGDALAAPATMFPVRRAWRYVPHLRMQAEGQPTLGSTAFRTDNPPFGAVVTYHLSSAGRDGAGGSARGREAMHGGGRAVPGLCGVGGGAIGGRSGRAAGGARLGRVRWCGGCRRRTRPGSIGWRGTCAGPHPTRSTCRSPSSSSRGSTIRSALCVRPGPIRSSSCGCCPTERRSSWPGPSRSRWSTS